MRHGQYNARVILERVSLRDQNLNAFFFFGDAKDICQRLKSPRCGLIVSLESFPLAAMAALLHLACAAKDVRRLLPFAGLQLASLALALLVAQGRVPLDLLLAMALGLALVAYAQHIIQETILNALTQGIILASFDEAACLPALAVHSGNEATREVTEKTTEGTLRISESVWNIVHASEAPRWSRRIAAWKMLRSLVGRL
jgi:hypothetical protein